MYSFCIPNLDYNCWCQNIIIRTYKIKFICWRFQYKKVIRMFIIIVAYVGKSRFPLRLVNHVVLSTVQLYNFQYALEMVLKFQYLQISSPVYQIFEFYIISSGVTYLHVLTRVALFPESRQFRIQTMSVNNRTVYILQIMGKRMENLISKHVYQYRLFTN